MLERMTTSEGAPAELGALVKQHDATVLVWWSSSCPCVTRYQERVEALRDAFPADRVAFAAIASNADDDAAKARAAAAEQGLTLPLIMDPAGGLADHLGVRSTPSVVVLDRGGNVRFKGWIDNERTTEESGRIAYAEEAVRAVLDGKPVPHKASPVYGCRVTRSLSDVGQCAPTPAVVTCHGG